MPRDRTWRTALYLLAVPFRDALAADTVSHHLAVASARHAPGISLLQLNQAHAAVHSHGVTPEFFEDAGAASTGSFDPVVSGRTVAAVQAVLAQPQAAAPPPEALAAASSSVSSGATSSMQLLPKESASPSMLSSSKLNEAASEASRIFSLVAEGARAAARNAAPSWFSSTEPAPVPTQAGEKATPSTVIVDATRGHKPMQPMAAAQLGHAEIKVPVAASAGAAASTQESASPGAMSFFGSVRRRADGEAPPAAPVAMIATKPSRAAVVAPAAGPDNEDAMQVLPSPQRTQAQLQADSRRAEELRQAEAREARELSRQADLEASMENVRLDFPR